MKNTTFILCCLFCVALLPNLAAQSVVSPKPPQRQLREVSFSGVGYDLGLQHGRELKKEIGEIVVKWKKSVESQLKTPADSIVKQFFAYAQFDKAIKTWTPPLYEEVRGIADGSGQAFNDIMVLNLLDEFWVWQDACEKHHCSSIGVPARDGQPGYIAQNMDLEAYTDGYQTLMRLARINNSPEQLILTYPGCIALNGLNEAGVGVCLNTMMQLKANTTGLPVAFIVRHILNQTNEYSVEKFIKTVPHASGQNYIVGIGDKVYDFEASANKVVRFDPKNANGTVYHTNHPVANDDLKDWYKESKSDNSTIRLTSVQERMAGLPNIKDGDLKVALRSKDDPENPVCRAFNQWGGTFASVLMTLTGDPKLQITAGPPDESEYKEVYFEASRTITGYAVDEINEPVTGVFFFDELRNIRVLSQFDGRYTLKVAQSCKVLNFYWDSGWGGTLSATSDTANLMLMLYSHKKFNYENRVARKQATFVTGIIKGETGEIVRPRVRIEGTETVAYADKDGNFTLTVSPQYDVLSFESDNYPTQQALLGDFKTIYVFAPMWQEAQPEKRRKKRRRN